VAHRRAQAANQEAARTQDTTANLELDPHQARLANQAADLRREFVAVRPAAAHRRVPAANLVAAQTLASMVRPAAAHRQAQAANQEAARTLVTMAK